jgi:tetratricopeptide (TPR) repeat protein
MSHARKSHQPTRPSRKAAFSVITILLPLLLLVGLEAGLRMADYGGNLDLVITKEVSDREFSSINRGVGKRFFPGSGITIPEPSEDMFAIRKGEKVKRIFCLGESTMAGFPYEFNATAPSMLRTELEKGLPGYTFEVVNVGLAAVGSHITKVFLEELLDYQPDLFVVYVGHNEFYGAYGVSSSVGPAGAPWITDLVLNLLKFRTVLFLRDLSMLFTDGRSAGQGEALMEQVVSDESIPYGGELYGSAHALYRRNIEKMIRCAGEAGIPVLFSVPVSNLSGQPPFRSISDPRVSEKERGRFVSLLRDGDTRTLEGRLGEVMSRYREAALIDSGYAGLYYAMGLVEHDLGRFEEADNAFRRARDLDGLRFRMPEEFGRSLVAICRTNGVPIADVDSAFRAESPDGIPGDALFLEHVHPNLSGYAIMARTWADAIRKHGLLVPAEEWRSPDAGQMTAENYPGVTGFDSVVGRIRIAYLTHRWPFQTTGDKFAFRPSGKPEEIALRYVQQKIPWQSARYELAAHYAEEGRFDLAREEIRAVAMVVPFSYEPLLRIADYYLQEGRYDEARAAYMKCLEIEQNPYAPSKLAILMLNEGRYDDAIAYVLQSLKLGETTRYQLPSRAIAVNHYFLGFAHAKAGRREEAREALRKALRIDPNLGSARELLAQLERGE